MEISTQRKQSVVYYSYILLFIVLAFYGLYHARSFLIPVSLAVLFAMLLWPVSRFLEKKGLSRAWGAGVCIIILLIFLASFIVFFTIQVSSFSSTFSNLQNQLNQVWQQISQFLESSLGIKVQSLFGKEPQEALLGSQQQQQGPLAVQTQQNRGLNITSYLSEAFSYFKSFATFTFKAIVGLIVVVVYTFLMLLYRHIFLNFIKKLSKRDEYSTAVSKEVAKVSQQYLAGRLIVIGIIAVLNSVALSLIGVKQAIFFGVLAAFLDLIPYIGIMIGAGLPLLMSLVNNQQLWPFFAVLGWFVFAQLLENYFLTPKIVGTKVRLNPLFTLMAVLVGGYLWGVAGMILFIPFLAMLKIIFDHVESLHPYGYLVGDPEHRTEKKTPDSSRG